MPELSAKPFERSYWVVPGRLLAGCYPGDADPAAAAAKLTALLDAGIRCVVALTEAHECGRGLVPVPSYEPTLKELAATRRQSVDVERCPIEDMGVPTAAQMRQTLDAIDSHLAAGQPVYLHCWGGYGRTGTVVGCWLARHGLAVGAKALERLCELRTGMRGESPQTDAQRAMVTAWHAGD